MKITIPRNYLKACAIFASHDQIRYVLNGVYVEPDETGATLCATDGRRLFALRVESKPGGRDLNPFIIPRTLIDAAPKQVPKTSGLIVEYADGRVSMEGETTVSAKAVGGKYPEWRSIVPSKPAQPLTQLHLDMSFLADFGKAFKMLFKNSQCHIGAADETSAMTIRPSGTKPECFGVLMPTRTVIDFKIPAWAKTKEDAK